MKLYTAVCMCVHVCMVVSAISMTCEDIVGCKDSLGVCVFVQASLWMSVLILGRRMAAPSKSKQIHLLLLCFSLCTPSFQLFLCVRLLNSIRSVRLACPGRSSRTPVIFNSHGPAVCLCLWSALCWSGPKFPRPLIIQPASLSDLVWVRSVKGEIKKPEDGGREQTEDMPGRGRE